MYDKDKGLTTEKKISRKDQILIHSIKKLRKIHCN